MKIVIARSVLVVKVAAVGDAVMALPMLTAIRAIHPGARISWMCGASIRPLLTLVPGIDEIIELDDARLFSSRRIERLKVVLNLWRRVAGRSFDLIVIAHRDRRYRLLTLPLRHREVRWLARSQSRSQLVCGRSYGDEYVRLVTGIDDWRAERYSPPVPAFAASNICSEMTARAAGRPIVVLAPGGARNAARTSPLKRWPLERYTTLAKALTARGHAVVVVGDSSESWVREAFDALPVIDLVGRTDISDLLGLFQRCDVVVAHDSGPLHLASLVQARIIALFGPTSPNAFAPYGSDIDVLWPGQALPCAPCYDGREFADCDNNRCMQMIEVDTVVARVCARARTINAAPDAYRSRP